MAYSVADPFPFTSIAIVLRWVAAAEKEMADGKSSIGVSAGDVSRQSLIQKNASERHELCLQSLCAKDPATYAAFATVGATVTGVNFAGFSSSSSS